MRIRSEVTAIINSRPAEVVFQIAALNEELGNIKEAEDKFKVLIHLVPSDPAVLQRLGAIFARCVERGLVLNINCGTEMMTKFWLTNITWR
jgi:hypothetical protein